MKQTIIIAMGEANKFNGNGFRAVVVPSIMDDTRDMRDQLGFRPNCLEAGRFFWKGDITFQSVEITLDQTQHKDVVGGTLAGFERNYTATNVVDFGGINDPIIKKAITTWLADN